MFVLVFKMFLILFHFFVQFIFIFVNGFCIVTYFIFFCLPFNFVYVSVETDKKERSTADSSTNITKVVVTKDINGEVLKKYLEFIQSGNIASKDISKELLLVAIKNSNHRLVNICDKHFSSLVNHQNVIDLLNLATENSLPLITAAAVNYVTKNLDPKNILQDNMTTGASILNQARRIINGNHGSKSFIICFFVLLLSFCHNFYGYVCSFCL